MYDRLAQGLPGSAISTDARRAWLIHKRFSSLREAGHERLVAVGEGGEKRFGAAWRAAQVGLRPVFAGVRGDLRGECCSRRRAEREGACGVSGSGRTGFDRAGGDGECLGGPEVDRARPQRVAAMWGRLAAA